MAAAIAERFAPHLGWSRWFHCESSFDLSLAPRAAGLYAVARQDDGGKQLMLIKVEAAEDLFQALNQLFTAQCPLRGLFEKGRCLLRYARVPDAPTRRAALSSLQAWLASPGETRSAVVEDFLHGQQQFRPFRDKSD